MDKYCAEICETEKADVLFCLKQYGYDYRMPIGKEPKDAIYVLLESKTKVVLRWGLNGYYIERVVYPKGLTKAEKEIANNQVNDLAIEGCLIY